MSPVDEVTRGRQVAENFCQEHWPEASFDQIERLGEWFTQHAIRTQPAKDPVATFDEAFAGTTWPDQKISEGGTNMRAAGESPARVEEQSALPGTRSVDQDSSERAAVTGLGREPKGPSASSPPSDPRRESALPGDTIEAAMRAHIAAIEVGDWRAQVLAMARVNAFVVPMCRELAALRKVAEAARELTSWDWLRNLFQDDEADEVRNEVAALETALAAVPSSGGGQ